MAIKPFAQQSRVFGQRDAVSRTPFAAQPQVRVMLVLIHVSSRNTNRLGSSRCWCVFHLARNRATFGRKLRAGQQCFFDGLTRLADKAPDRVRRHVHTRRGQFRRQGTHREVGLLSQSQQHPVPAFASKHRAAAPADLAGKLPATRAVPLTDPNGRGHRNPEPLRSGPNRPALLQSRRNPRPKVH